MKTLELRKKKTFLSLSAQWKGLEDKSRPGQGLTREQHKIVSRIVITNDLNYSMSTETLLVTNTKDAFFCFPHKLTVTEKNYIIL